MTAIHDCDLCGSPVWHELPQDPRIAVCRKCGFIFVPERRSSAEIAASWSDIYKSGQYDPNWPAVKARLYYVAQWIEQNLGGMSGKQLLDIGAGNGLFAFHARNLGASTFGIEPAMPDDPSRWPPGTIKHAVEDGPLSEKFDIVTINWTLENCGDCLAMLRFAREHCKPDGWVVVATGSRILVPYKKWLSAYLNPNIPADLHCFRWSEASLNRAMRMAGITPEAINPFMECDWLVIAGQPGAVEPSPEVQHDDPNEVLAYFASWSKLCS